MTTEDALEDAWKGNVVPFASRMGAYRGPCHPAAPAGRTRSTVARALAGAFADEQAWRETDGFLAVALKSRPPVFRSQAANLRLLPGGKT